MTSDTENAHGNLGEKATGHGEGHNDAMDSFAMDTDATVSEADETLTQVDSGIRSTVGNFVWLFLSLFSFVGMVIYKTVTSARVFAFTLLWILASTVVHAAGMIAYTMIFYIPVSFGVAVYQSGDITGALLNSVSLTVFVGIYSIASIFIFRKVWSYTSGLGYVLAGDFFDYDPFGFMDPTSRFGKYSRWGRFDGSGGMEDIHADVIEEFEDYDRKIADPEYDTSDDELVAALYLTREEREFAVAGGDQYDEYLNRHDPGVDMVHVPSDTLQKQVTHHYNKGTLDKRVEL